MPFGSHGVARRKQGPASPATHVKPEGLSARSFRPLTDANLVNFLGTKGGSAAEIEAAAFRRVPMSLDCNGAARGLAFGRLAWGHILPESCSPVGMGGAKVRPIKGRVCELRGSRVTSNPILRIRIRDLAALIAEVCYLRLSTPELRRSQEGPGCAATRGLHPLRFAQKQMGTRAYRALEHSGFPAQWLYCAYFRDLRERIFASREVEGI